MVKAIDQDSQQLAQALIDGTKIVITTLQKFPFVMTGLLRAASAESVAAPSETEPRSGRRVARDDRRAPLRGHRR